MKIIFIQTGGTIDKDYPQKTKGWGFEIGAPAIKRILERLNPSFEYDILTAFKKDSQDITIEDRLNLSQLINTHPHKDFIITHGTDTLIETALFLSNHTNQKRIILTGAMLPEMFKNSDADINMGGAISALSHLPQGVYICMNGIIKNASEIKRDMETGKFS